MNGRQLALQLFGEALDLSPEQRKSFLDGACHEDAALRNEVEALLSASEEIADDLFPTQTITSHSTKEPNEATREQADLELKAGDLIGEYEVRDEIAVGGMGILYRATDTRLGRTVALKVLRPEVSHDDDRRRRLLREAQAVASLNHPHVVTTYHIGRIQDDPVERDYIAMEYVDGCTLSQIIPRRGMPMESFLRYALQLCDALVAAHAKKVLHRDLKPTNVMLTRADQIKVLDFGLAKRMVHDGRDDASDASSPTRADMREAPTMTQTGQIVGTPAYMSPEQVAGIDLDERSDVFSLGAVLYEMLTGQKAFCGDSMAEMLAAVGSKSPTSIREIRPDVSADLDEIVTKCLAKDPVDRYQSANDLREAVVGFDQRIQARRHGWRRAVRRPKFVLLAVTGLAIVSWIVGAYLISSAQKRWAMQYALPQIVEQIDRDQLFDAYCLAKQAIRYAGDDAHLQTLLNDITVPLSIDTTPSGASVLIRGYGGDAKDWRLLGTTPLSTARAPATLIEIRLERADHEPVHRATNPLIDPQINISMEREDRAPQGMVHVPAATHEGQSFDSFWLDRNEVTNREYKAFMDAGGYEREEWWEASTENGEATEDDGTTLRSRFVDRTGVLGPACWSHGTYPPGQGDEPVSGVSWYEARAYAKSVGKSLPTVYHWTYAAHAGSRGIDSSILEQSNFESDSARSVGQGLGPFGTHDMAGNVKEWCFNAEGPRRFILGGGYDEPPHMFTDWDAQSPLERAADYGFRCAKFKLSSDLLAPREHRNDANHPPQTHVTDAEFRVIENLYEYDSRDLRSKVLSVDESHLDWRREKIVFDAAYEDEQVTAYLYVPRDVEPPYQTVVHFPGIYAVHLRSSERLSLLFVDYFIRSGRALLYPVYKGTYERHLESPWDNWKEQVVQRSKDIRRSLDYLATRPDIDMEKLAFHGVSWGAMEGPIHLAMEPRFCAAILAMGGLPFVETDLVAHPSNFAPRVTIPVLMLNGRRDFVLNVEASQLPLYNAFGTSPEHKKHVLFESGHIIPRAQSVRESLAWLDKYLGPVERLNSAKLVETDERR